MDLNKVITFLLTLIIIRLTLPITRKMYSNAKRNARNLLLPRTNNRYTNDETFLNRGGYIAGLVNDGNTCFMNSVLQSLASSKELAKFLDSIIENSENTKHEIDFSITLLDLLNKLNTKYGTERTWFETNKLLKTMTNGPNKNIILGYDQEDAQEFFQHILSDLEKNVKLTNNKSDEKEKEHENGKCNKIQHIPKNQLPNDALLGQDNLDKVGTVYIPTEQVEPNLINTKDEKYYTPFKLVTPLDGITAERIGCLTCGENGGIRYSVFSGLSLNLPGENIGSTLKLSELLNEWSKPEIIEGVDCNRCALHAVREHLEEQLDASNDLPKKLTDAIKDRIDKLDEILAKPSIDDEDYKKLHTENMVRRCSKSKQIIISRPPPLLSIHINRSVFDPRTYTIRKNNSRVLFKSRLNLSPWSCTPHEINLDARLPLSKKEPNFEESSEDEHIGGEYYANLHHKFQRDFDDSEEDDSDNEYNYNNNRKKDVQGYDPLNGEMDSSDYSTDKEDDEEGVNYIEETDALGNTIRKRVTKVSNSVDVDEKEEEDILNDLDAKMSEESDDEREEEIEIEHDEVAEDEEDESDKDDEGIPEPPMNSLPQARFSTVPATPLTYSLRSVIVHYGTHNYGHYIAFRRYRGYWWRISDETVYIVDEVEVLSTPGVFMLFYEYDYDEATGKLKDDVETFEEDAPIEIVGNNKPDELNGDKTGEDEIAETQEVIQNQMEIN